MTREEFINKIAPLVCKYAQQYNILCPSAVISQAVLESNGGTSELAINAHNYFGLKYRPNRCPSACGIYYKVGSEQNKNGSYTSSAMQWMKFLNMDNGVKGYFDFINISNYANLKGVTDPKTYLENIKKDKYATSINYVQNLMDVIKKYNLTQYDNLNNKIEIPKGGNKMKVNIHAGHNPEGKIACGAVGLIKESTEARNVKDKVIAMLKSQGHIVYDCTCENGRNQNDVLKKIVSKCNEHPVDLDVSIHFNAGANDRSGNGVTTGTEVFIYNSNSKAKPYAQRIVRNIASLGFKLRDDAVKDDVKNSSYLYVLKNTKSPALLIEVCFVDDKDDVKLYNADKVAQAIVKGITGITTTNTTSSNNSPSKPVNNSASSSTYTYNQFIKEVQSAIGAKVDGIAGNETYSKCPTVSKSKNNRHAVVKPLQKYLNALGYNCGVADGIAGAKFDNAAKAWAKANGCVADGEFTKNGKSWKNILGIK